MQSALSIPWHACRYDVTKQHPRGKVLAAAFDELFDDELSSWLLAEMAQNRDKQIGPKKVIRPLYAIAQAHHAYCICIQACVAGFLPNGPQVLQVYVHLGFLHTILLISWQMLSTCNSWHGQPNGQHPCV